MQPGPGLISLLLPLTTPSRTACDLRRRSIFAPLFRPKYTSRYPIYPPGAPALTCPVVRPVCPPPHASDPRGPGHGFEPTTLPFLCSFFLSHFRVSVYTIVPPLPPRLYLHPLVSRTQVPPTSRDETYAPTNGRPVGLLHSALFFLETVYPFVDHVSSSLRCIGQLSVRPPLYPQLPRFCGCFCSPPCSATTVLIDLGLLPLEKPLRRSPLTLFLAKPGGGENYAIFLGRVFGCKTSPRQLKKLQRV